MHVTIISLHACSRLIQPQALTSWPRLLPLKHLSLFSCTLPRPKGCCLGHLQSLQGLALTKISTTHQPTAAATVLTARTVSSGRGGWGSTVGSSLP